MARWLAGLALAARMLGASVVVDSSTTLLIDTGEPGPVQRAARDLAADMEKVFGRPVRVVHQRAEAAATTICVALAHNLPVAVAMPSGWEVLRIQAVRDPWPASKARQAVVLTGSDARGAIFAVYQFAQEFLDARLPGTKVEEGVDTFYGYYTLHVLKDGKVYGMLGVNGYSGWVWYHEWHNNFVRARELEAME